MSKIGVSPKVWGGGTLKFGNPIGKDISPKVWGGGTLKFGNPIGKDISPKAWGGGTLKFGNPIGKDISPKVWGGGTLKFGNPIGKDISPKVWGGLDVLPLLKPRKSYSKPQYFRGLQPVNLCYRVSPGVCGRYIGREMRKRVNLGHVIM